eukprot:COSAG01_NODE_48398_length_381_cov_2.514184_1_plen_114_part_10
MDVFLQAVPLLVGVLYGSCLDELKRCRLFQTETKIVSFFEMFSVGSQKVNHIAAFDEVSIATPAPMLFQQISHTLLFSNSRLSRLLLLVRVDDLLLSCLDFPALVRLRLGGLLL